MNYINPESLMPNMRGCWCCISIHLRTMVYRFVRLEARQWRSTTQASTKRSSRRGLAQRRADAGGGGPPLPVLPVVRRRLHHAVRELHFLRRPLPPPSLLCSCLHACAPKEKKKKKSRRCSNFIHIIKSRITKSLPILSLRSASSRRWSWYDMRMMLVDTTATATSPRQEPAPPPPLLRSMAIKAFRIPTAATPASRRDQGQLVLLPCGPLF